jgi:hypothetical protein
MVIMPQKKARHVSCVDQKEAPSSRANKTPPMGAPNAAATPAAAPQATKSRFSGSVRNSRTRVSPVTPKSPRVPWANDAPMTAPEWIMGPSLPTGSAAATENKTPKALQTNVRTLTILGTLMPFK